MKITYCLLIVIKVKLLNLHIGATHTNTRRFQKLVATLIKSSRSTTDWFYQYYLFILSVLLATLDSIFDPIVIAIRLG